jgi:hypothetical protein
MSAALERFAVAVVPFPSVRTPLHTGSQVGVGSTDNSEAEEDTVRAERHSSRKALEHAGLEVAEEDPDGQGDQDAEGVEGAVDAEGAVDVDGEELQDGQEGAREVDNPAAAAGRGMVAHRNRSLSSERQRSCLSLPLGRGEVGGPVLPLVPVPVAADSSGRGPGCRVMSRLTPLGAS